MITETPIKDFNSKLKYDIAKYPQCSCGKPCFKFFFNYCAIAARASGKSWNMASIIKHYQDNVIKDHEDNVYKTRVFIISPTLEQNEVFKSLDVDFENDTYDHYSDDILDEIIDKITADKESWMDYKKYKSVYKKFMQLKVNEINKLTDEELQLLIRHDFEDYKDLQPVQPKVYFLILDDLLGTKSLSTSKRSKLMNLYIKNRHHNLCCMIAVQSIKGLPKEIRLNTSVFFLGRFANTHTILPEFWEEVSNCITLDKLQEMYDHCVNHNKYGSLIVDLTQDEKSFMRGLDAILEVE